MQVTPPLSLRLLICEGVCVGGLVLEIIIRANICCVPDIAPKALHMLPLQPFHLPCEVSAIHSRHLLPNESKTGGLLIEEIFKAGHLRIHKMSTLLNVMLVRVHWLGDLLMQSQASLRPGPVAKGLPCAALIARTCAAVCVPIWVSLTWSSFTDARDATYTQNPSGLSSCPRVATYTHLCGILTTVSPPSCLR